MQEAGVGLAGPHRAGHDTRNDVRRPRRVVEAPARRRRQRAVGREVRHVGLPVAEEHLDHVRDALVDVVLREVEPVAHGEQVAQGDGVARVVAGGPLGHRSGGIEVEPPVADEQADHGVEHRLGHRPAQQRCVGGHPRRRTVEVLQRSLVALDDDAPAVHDDDGEGLGHRPVVGEDVVEQRRQIDPGRELARGPLLGRPFHAGGLRRQRDQAAHTEERKAISAALVSAGFSCWTQCAAPSTTVVPR